MNLNKITIIQHNVNHWHNKKFELYNTYRHIDPDVILLNDTGPTENAPIKIQQYTVYSKNIDNRAHHGTAIAIKSHLNHRIHDDFETDLLAITIDTRQGPMTIATDYIPPQATYLHTIDYLRLLERPYPVYLFGDLNARHRLFNTSTETKVGKMLATLIDRNLLQHLGPNFPTVIRTNTSTHPDIALGNSQIFHNILLAPGPATSSDHIPVIITISANPIQIPIRPRKHFAKANWPAFQQELLTVPTPTTNQLSPSEIDVLLSNWEEKINTATDNNVPTLRYRIPPGVKPTDSIKLLQQQHETAYSHIKQNGATPFYTNIVHYTRRRIGNEYRDLQTHTWNQIVQNIDIENDDQKFFKSIKRFQNNNNKQSIPYIRDHHNNKVHDTPDKEALFRSHWSEIFRNDKDDEDFDQGNIELVTHSINNNSDYLKPFPHSNINILDLTFPAITTQELKKSIFHLKHRSPGPSGITAHQLKQLPTNMISHLAFIFNACLSLGYFPKTFKHAHMIFIPKGSLSQHQVQNYRPISLLDIHGKIFDKILNTRLNHHLTINNLHNDIQHGFRGCRGTHTALALFHETISNAHHKNHTTDVVLRDVAKAFDKVWHDGLNHKILRLNIHSSFKRILSNFITDRTASIRISHYTGPPFTLLSGVPQGACLSPTLFNYYTSDIPIPPPAHHTVNIAYADDITQIISHQHPPTTFGSEFVKKAIDHINSFEKQWKIKTNPNKFQIIPISRKLPSDTININNSNISYTCKGSALGLEFNTTGYICHAETRKRTAEARLLKLKIFSGLSQHNKLKIFKTTILPALIYPTVPLNSLSACSKYKLQVAQNKALRFITNTPTASHTTNISLHISCNIDPINITLHKQAQRTWETIKYHLPRTYNRLVNNTPPNRTRRFHSSRLEAERPPPEPIFVR